MSSRPTVAVIIAATILLAAACGDEAHKTTGVAAVDEVVKPVEEHDQTALRELVRFTTLPCTRATGAGGPPKCAPEEAEGTEVAVFEFYSCEVDWRREGELDAALQTVAETSPRRYAAFAMHPDYLPGGRYRDAAAIMAGPYVAVFDGADAGDLPRGLAVAIDGEGGIVAIWPACGAGSGAASMMPSGEIDFLLEPEG